MKISRSFKHFHEKNLHKGEKRTYFFDFFCEKQKKHHQKTRKPPLPHTMKYSDIREQNYVEP